MSKPNPELFHLIGDQSKDVYFVFDLASARFSYLNDAFSKVFQIQSNQDKQVLSSILSIVHPEDRDHVMDCLDEALTDFKAHKYEFRICVGEEVEKFLRISIYPIMDHGAAIQLVGVVEDFTVEKENNFHIEKINARKNTALEIVSHDLKEPLAMISLAVSDLLRDQLFDGQDRILKSLTFINDMCERNIQLIRNLINHEFLSSSEIEIRTERSDLVQEIKDVIGFYQHAELNLFRNFEFSSSDEKLYAMIDSMKLMQVINNLISNSIKFTEVNGSIKIHIQDQVETLLIIVKDNGIGIPQHLQPYLFERFSIAMREGLHGEDSWGLGMFIIKTIVEMHKGKIWFESEEHKGSTFYIQIPK